jgi:hypothetical protein
MARYRRTTCRHIKQHDPKLSTLHETGVSPLWCWGKAPPPSVGKLRNLLQYRAHASRIG